MTQQGDRARCLARLDAANCGRTATALPDGRDYGGKSKRAGQHGLDGVVVRDRGVDEEIRGANRTGATVIFKPGSNIGAVGQRARHALAVDGAARWQR